MGMVELFKHLLHTTAYPHANFSADPRHNMVIENNMSTMHPIFQGIIIAFLGIVSIAQYRTF